VKMSTPKRKLNCLDIQTKAKIIKTVESSPSRTKQEIAKEFGIPSSTLSTVLKNKNKIIESLEVGEVDLKRKRSIKYRDVEEAILKWFHQNRHNNVPISGPILKEKATQFAKELEHPEFKASEGWLEKFKSRNNIVFRKLCGESASVSETVCDEWKKSLNTIIEGYDPKDLFNCDETGLYYECLPDRSLILKSEDCLLLATFESNFYLLTQLPNCNRLIKESFRILKACTERKWFEKLFY